MDTSCFIVCPRVNYKTCACWPS